MTQRTLRNLALIPAVLACHAAAHTQQTTTPTLHGRVLDPLGAAVPGAHVRLFRVAPQGSTPDVQDGPELSSAVAIADSNANGSYTLTLPAPGRYRIEIIAPGFPVTDLPAAFYAGDDRLALTLDTPTGSDEITVTATGTPQPLAQSGAPITVLNQEQDYLHLPEVQDPLRLVPGLQITQTGQAGGLTSLYIRGGQSSYNKVLLDGVPVNDIGGSVEFANLATTGIARVEVLRQPNSALYGSDDLSGVVLLTTARGTTPLPQLVYAVDGGNLGLFHQEANVSGAQRRLDYYGAISRFQTDNNEPDNQFHNVTSVINAGYKLDQNTDLRFIWRHLDTNGGQPNALALYGVPELANQKAQQTYFSGSANQQTTTAWHNQLQYGHEALNSQFIEYAPTGVPVSDGMGGIAEYLGLNQTITGANGYSVTGQAYFTSAPPYTPFMSQSRRDFVYAQTDYQLNRHTAVLGAFNYAAERGSSSYDPSISEGNYSYTLQLAGDFGSQLFYTLGSGIEDNAVYGKALTPRASLAYYLVRPGGNGLLTGTKLHASFGKGVKEGSIDEQTSSLYGQLTPAQRTQFGVTPLSAEYSRTYDAGVEQQFVNGRARANLSYFHNEYTNGIQYIPNTALPLLGVSQGNAAALVYGAYVNSQAYRSQGAELELEYRVNRHIFARAGYTYLAAVVQRSFSSDALSPSFNTSSSFSNIAIGAYSPLDGARPFRLAPHSGYFAISYTARKLTTQLSGTLVGKRDDSTFLSDANFGTSLLLPNRNLDGAYQRLDLMADYRVNHLLTFYANLNNVLNQSYQEAFGYPALPITVRGGVKFTLGGESFRLR